MPPAPSRLTYFLFIAFVLLSVAVVYHTTLPMEDAILSWIGTVRSPTLTTVMRFITNIGDGAVEVPFVLIVIGVLWRIGRKQSARQLFLTAAIGEALYAVAKASFQRPRPTIIPHLTKGGWYAYPSGHAMLAPIIWGVSLLLLARLATNPVAKQALKCLAVVLPISIAISRVYLGVHYPSDVVGGLLLGTGWSLLWWETLNKGKE